MYMLCVFSINTEKSLSRSSEHSSDQGSDIDDKYHSDKHRRAKRRSKRDESRHRKKSSHLDSKKTKTTIDTDGHRHRDKRKHHKNKDKDRSADEDNSRSRRNKYARHGRLQKKQETHKHTSLRFFNSRDCYRNREKDRHRDRLCDRNLTSNASWNRHYRSRSRSRSRSRGHSRSHSDHYNRRRDNHTRHSHKTQCHADRRDSCTLSESECSDKDGAPPQLTISSAVASTAVQKKDSTRDRSVSRNSVCRKENATAHNNESLQTLDSKVSVVTNTTTYGNAQKGDESSVDLTALITCIPQLLDQLSSTHLGIAYAQDKQQTSQLSL
ncbi:hypothetical protein RFI_28225 [Reticulomyxa filosa]|uniref:Uncharacterized protein n=1 Tax=Reticulomyxa filosa TaxID=46433 RepID=X6M6S0_RETFI|nr:hypothetical protein RFI_28225 [Reticulomyxa filosa]|eukprot:ETO09162.1 hypothetical protein RFI_28225 [Reticulomyxa filosa]